MKKRVFSLLICLLFILTALPLTASAEVIGQVSVGGVKAPLAGQTPVYYARTRTAGYEVYEYNSAVYRNGVCWYDEGAKKEMTLADTFAEGGIYTLKVYLYALEGSSFKVNGSDSAVTALYNDKEAKIVNATPKGTRDPANILLLTYTFGPAGVEKVSHVEFTVDPPKAGDTPGAALQKETEYFCYSIEWYDCADDHLLDKTDRFQGGHRYQVLIWAKANPGYEFTVDRQTGQTDVTGVLNDTEATVMNPGGGKDPRNTVLMVYTFDAVPVISLDLLAVADVKEPAGGEAPSYGFTIAGEGYYSHVNDGDVVWYNDETRQPMAAGEKFVTGNRYTVEIALYNHQGYELDPQAKGTVNGLPAEVIQGGDGKAVLRAQFTAGESPIIYAVNITRVGEPVLGDVPLYAADVDRDAPYEVDRSMDDGKTIFNGVQWVDGEGNPMGCFDTFVGGVTYRVHVFLKAKEGRSFATDVTNNIIVAASINGRPADDMYGDPDLIGVVREYLPLPPTYINEVGVNLLPPAADQMPDYEPWTASEGAEIRTFPVANGLKGVRWYDLTDEAWMEPTDTFRNGHAYRVFITVQAAAGYRFVNNGDLPLLTGTVNNLPCGVDALLDPDKIAVLAKDFAVGIWGDVDRDGEVTSTDARLTLQYAVGKIGSDGLDLTVADVDGDKEVTSTDARLILQRAVNKIQFFPVEAKG